MSNIPNYIKTKADLQEEIALQEHRLQECSEHSEQFASKRAQAKAIKEAQEYLSELKAALATIAE